MKSKKSLTVKNSIQINFGMRLIVSPKVIMH